jgi:hypothetical protein
LDFDQEAYTYSVFDETVAEMQKGRTQTGSQQDSAASNPASSSIEGMTSETQKGTALPKVLETELMGTA